MQKYRKKLVHWAYLRLPAQQLHCALGDALAVCVLDLRDFSAEDFARSHPGGNIGRRLIVRVKDVMRTGNAIPQVKDGELLSVALTEMTKKGLGLTAIVDEDYSRLAFLLMVIYAALLPKAFIPTAPKLPM